MFGCILSFGPPKMTSEIPMIPKAIDAPIKIRVAIFCMNLVYHGHMTTKQISGGTIHKLPTDLRDAVTATPKALQTWEDITSLARNEWICWVTSGKKADTRDIRIRKAISKLSGGMRRPCCWAGCTHR